MQVTLQVKLAVDRAARLRDRLNQLRKAARVQAEAAERQARKAKTEAERSAHADAARRARAQELEMNLSNLMRAMVYYGMDQLLNDEDTVVAAVIQASRVPRGRPRLAEGFEPVDVKGEGKMSKGGAR